MAKFRVYEVAKKLGKDNKEILEILKSNQIDVKNHMSMVSDDQVAIVEKALAPKKNTSSSKKQNFKKQENGRKDGKGGQNRNQNGDRRRNGKNQPNNRNENKDHNKNENRKDFKNQRNNQKNQKNKKQDGDRKILRKENPQNSQKFNHKNNKKNKKFNKNQPQEQRRKKKTSGPGAFIKPEPVKKPEIDPDVPVKIPPMLTLKELADALSIPANDIIKKLLISGGGMLNLNSELDFEKAEEIALEFDRLVEMEQQVDVIEEILKDDEEDDESKMVERPPVVCVMGHVDHGKTSLLDKIRSTHVTTGEAGGITQHIGAYTVETANGKITFLDTPGHEAFTSMRMRGAQSTDIAILVVAADDGVMPQTVEAINHAKAAEVEIIVAINKIDKESANIERVKQELTEYELIPEDWGGSTIFCPVSAHTGEGIPELLDMVSLTAEVLELKANPDRKARGIVLEAQLDKGRGPVATVLVQKGTLHVGDAIAVGNAHGKVRAMINDKGKRIKSAGPSTPVEILGLSEVPYAGEVCMAMDSEKEARAVAEKFIAYGREKMLSETKSQLSLDDLFDQIQAGSVKELNIIVKADVQGSVEAVKQSLEKLSNDEVAVKVIHGGVGAINESDVMLASASNAIIIGFNVRPEPAAKDAAAADKVDMRLYRVIYNAIEDIESAMKGMLDPEFVEKVTGHAEVRQLFKASGVGTIAGSYVTDGTIQRDSSARVIRDGIVIHEGKLASIQRGKDAVKEVRSGFECGLVMENFNDIKEGDQIESFVMEEVPR
ncbi:translation initiation factor IF-2 [Anaerostipes butyraticus]|uniref:Translation initiation factor IF-2 n=3 Tax=Anaerostipes TaxID=207244 RepID=A0A916Q6C1_9FIRM|nr:translation initiation factor IF-2 [Anaerostipes butyraticus]GFO85167.1 translation initiation factor IF-2 [Anaerostipes butyraticus]HJC82312.1 translation initiation factor IF-2 [Candidatus Anaerostipes avicola]